MENLLGTSITISIVAIVLASIALYLVIFDKCDKKAKTADSKIKTKPITVIKVDKEAGAVEEEKPEEQEKVQASKKSTKTKTSSKKAVKTSEEVK